MTRLSRRDLAFIAVCIALAAIATFIIVRYYDAAFPEAAIDFRFDRNTSRPLAEQLLRAQRIDVRGMKHAVGFDSDESARIFLERSNAAGTMKHDVRLWTWHHRWFRPQQEEELSVDVATTGEIMAFSHKIPEERAIAGVLSAPPLEFLRSIGVRVDDLQLISTSERRLPKRIQRIYTWESKSIHPAGAPYRHSVTADGTMITSYSQRLKVPEAWLRSYRELRSKNSAAGAVDTIFAAGSMIAALIVFIVRLRRGDLRFRFLIWIGIAAVLLTAGASLNSLPAQFAYYDTTTSYPAFLGSLALDVILPSLGTAMLLIVICGAGEVLYRERMPGKLAMPRVFSRRALSSRRVFLSLILGYALVPLFVGYQIVFYLTARRFGAWAPAEVPYDELLNSAVPWAAVLFAGFFPALSEEFLSRAFSIPFFEKLFRSRVVAIVIAAFIWGFGHSTYPNQPFYIRGLEVGIVGVIAGLLMQRFGLLPLLIWHFTVDAVYTATPLFASGNVYYIASAAAASLLFALPLIVAVARYVRNGGFAPDGDLSNATIPLSAPGAHEPEKPPAELPPAMRVTAPRLLACAAALIVAAVAIALRPPSAYDAIDYRIGGERAKAIARAYVHEPQQRVIAAPVEGFRSWDAGSSREDGGAPGGFDSAAADYLLRNGVSMRELVGIFRTKLEAGTWTVRFFTPAKKEEIFVEVDPRTSRAIGYHKYVDEQTPGPSLTQEQAAAIARRAFATYGIDVRAFELREALTFQQPKRRDWLFHFQERTPLAAQAFRRVTVRVAGAEVTQFNKTVKVPESVEREAAETNLMNIVLYAMKRIGAIALLGLVIAGVVIASRGHGLPWRRALRWTAILSIIPIASIASRYELTLFGYSTSMAWETFRVRLLVQFIVELARDCGIMFLAIAGLEATLPYALNVLSREGRARFGRAAAVAAVTAVCIAAIAGTALQWIEIAWPRASSIDFSAPEIVAIPLPALVDGLQAVFAAIAIAGAVALYAQTVRRWVAPITITALFFIAVDPGASMQEMPLMLARSLAVAAIAWLVARYVLDANPLAWLLTAFVAMLLQSGATLLQNQRTDLMVNAIVLFALAVIATAWAAWPRSADA